jgi:O-antigen/teichoic acid export membrane protein
MKKKAIFHNIIGGFSNFGFMFFTSLIFLPYYFNFISNEVYGIWLGGISLLSLFSIFEANLSLILTQQLAVKLTKNELSEFSKYLTSAVFFAMCSSVVIIMGTYIFKTNIFHLISDSELNIKLFSDSFFIYSISLSLTIISSYIGSVFQVYLVTLKQPIYNIIASFIGVLFTVIYVSEFGVLSIAIGYLLKSSIYSILVIIGAFKILRSNNIVYEFSFFSLRKLLKGIGLPFLSKIMLTSTSNVQNFIIALYIGSSTTTVFEITKKLPYMNISLINIFAMATFTSFALLYSESKNDATNESYTKYYFDLIRILLVSSLTIIFIIEKDFIRLWVGLDKYAGIFILALICICCLLDQLRMILAQQYYSKGKYNLTAITDSIYSILFIISAVILIPIYGLIGIVFSGIISNIFYFAICKFFENKSKVNIVSKIITKTLFLDLMLVSIISFLSMSLLNQFHENAFVTLVVATFTFTLIIFYYYRREKPLFSFLIINFAKPLLNKKNL